MISKKSLKVKISCDNRKSGLGQSKERRFVLMESRCQTSQLECLYISKYDKKRLIWFPYTWNVIKLIN